MSNKSSGKEKGKLLYFENSESKVIHADDKLFCKFYGVKNGVSNKVTIESGKTGGEYTLSVKTGTNAPKVTKHNKKEILAFLKTDPNLAFMTDYISKTSSLTRKRGSNKASKKGSMKGSKKGSKKTKKVSRKKGSKASKKGSKKASKKGSKK